MTSLPRQSLFNMLPESFNRIEFRTMRRLKNGNDIIWPRNSQGFMKTAVIRMKLRLSGYALENKFKNS